MDIKLIFEKSHKEFRKQLSEYGITLRIAKIGSDAFQNQQDIVFPKMTLGAGVGKVIAEAELTSPALLIFLFASGSTIARKEKEDRLRLMITFWNNLAQKIGVSVVIFRSYGMYNDDICNELPFKMENLMPYANGNWSVINSISSMDMFVNVKTNFVQRVSESSERIKNQLHEFGEQNITFKYKKIHQKDSLSSWSFYYKGYEGVIHLKYENDNLYVTEDKLGYCRMLEPDNNDNLIEELLNISSSHVQLKNLIEPPMVHFDKAFEYVVSRHRLKKTIIREVFNVLTDDYEAEEIERLMVANNKLIKYEATNGWILCMILDKVFLIEEETSSLSYFEKSDISVATNLFRQNALKVAEKKFEEMKEHIESRIESFSSNN